MISALHNGSKRIVQSSNPATAYSLQNNTTQLHTYAKRDSSDAAKIGIIIALVGACLVFIPLLARTFTKHRALKIRNEDTHHVRHPSFGRRQTTPFDDHYPRPPRGSVSRPRPRMTSYRPQEEEEEQLPAYEPPSKPIATAETVFNQQPAAENGMVDYHQRLSQDFTQSEEIMPSVSSSADLPLPVGASPTNDIRSQPPNYTPVTTNTTAPMPPPPAYDRR
ncbi:hypothetical protein E3Q18_04345 [Wallemia mellicola]|nr:hypothetical protein E3Q18_04345 [Wallemia mellicola]TIC21551.1 hypothetical protein E3Q11_04379 [Wallemia mellicola]